MAEKAAQKTKAGNDDSMEEILHSIRDIIAEKTEGEGDEAMSDATNDEEVLELTEVVEEGVKSPAEDGGDALSNIDAALGEEEKAPAEEPAPEPEPQPEAPAEEPKPEAPAEEPAPEPEPQPEAPAEEPEPEAPAEEPAPEPAPGQPKRNLVSDSSAQQTIAALKELRDNIPKPEIHSPDFRSGNTVEDLVVEAIKPMLSDWLDVNLPIIVKELVQKEIEKLVPHETRD